MDPAPARLSVLGKERWIQRKLAPPLLGEQSKQVLEKIAGLSSGEIESLRERGIVS